MIQNTIQFKFLGVNNKNSYRLVIRNMLLITEIITKY
jgi:hypothetical protein